MPVSLQRFNLGLLLVFEKVHALIQSRAQEVLRGLFFFLEDFDFQVQVDAVLKSHIYFNMFFKKLHIEVEALILQCDNLVAITALLCCQFLGCFGEFFRLMFIPGRFSLLDPVDQFWNLFFKGKDFWAEFMKLVTLL